MALPEPLRSVDEVPALPAPPVPFRSPRRHVKVLNPLLASGARPPPPLEGASHAADEDEVGELGVGASS